MKNNRTPYISAASPPPVSPCTALSCLVGRRTGRNMNSAGYYRPDTGMVTVWNTAVTRYVVDAMFPLEDALVINTYSTWYSIHVASPMATFDVPATVFYLPRAPAVFMVRCNSRLCR